jgi:hypothetical protein
MGVMWCNTWSLISGALMTTDGTHYITYGVASDQKCDLSRESDGMGRRVIMYPRSTTDDSGDSAEISTLL